MGKLETDLALKGLLPRTWIRYVDDILTVIKRHELNTLQHVLNNEHPHATIKFTSETEQNKQLPSLDLLLTRNQQKIYVSLYHKPTHTQRFITKDSYCPRTSKLLAFNSIVYRMWKLPLSINSYMNELQTIKNIANTNCYTNDEIDKLVHKQARNIRKNSMSTLYRQQKQHQTTKRVSFNFTHEITIIIYSWCSRTITN